MRVLIVHNEYKIKGGEESVVQSDVDLLKKNGHDVEVYRRSNEELDGMNVFQKLLFLSSLKFSSKTYEELKIKIEEFRPDIVHCHNIFYVITPAVYWACKDCNAPVIQSFHNYRIFIPSGLLFNEDDVVKGDPEATLKKGIKSKSFKNSRLLTRILVNMLVSHWKKKTWQTHINAYTAATHFTKNQFVEMGLSESKFYIKPNYVSQSPKEPTHQKGNYMLYVGRLSEEKGVEFLINAWTNDFMPLKVAGTGPLAGKLAKLVNERGLKNVELLGFVEDNVLVDLMSQANCVIVPSLCYENFPMVVAQAYANGVAVMASDLGSLAEIVENNTTGKLFKTNDTNDLREKMTELAKSPEILHKMGQNAYQTYLTKYSPEASYEHLMEIYNRVLKYS